MAQMWRTGLPWNAENLQQRKIDYEHDIKGLAKDFVLQLDAAMPEEHKLPRDEDGSFNCGPRMRAKFGTVPKSTRASTSTARSSLWKNSPCCWAVSRLVMPMASPVHLGRHCVLMPQIMKSSRFTWSGKGVKNVAR